MATSTWRVLADDGAREPRRNLALDEALARLAAARPTLRLWRNSRCVVVGRSQLTAPHSVDLAVVAAVTGGACRPAPVTADEAALAEQLLERRYGRPSWHETGTP